MGVRYDYDKVKEYIESKGCTLLTKEYINNKQKLKIRCKCGDVFERSFQDFKNKKRYYCQTCSNNKMSIDKVRSEIESYGNKLLSTEYKNVYTSLLVKCGTCGETYGTTWELFKKSKTKTCPKCAEKIRKQRNIENNNGHYCSFHDVKLICESTGESELLSTEYIPGEKLKLKCKCGKEYEQNFYHIKDKVKNNIEIICPKCMARKGYDKMSKATISKGEQEILEYLLSKNIGFEREYIFNDCKYSDVLRFDFYIPNYNLVIEYDGRQHFMPVELFGGEEGFKIQIIKDGIKNNYCKSNNINMLRIPYYENTIKTLNDYFINKLIPR